MGIKAKNILVKSEKKEEKIITEKIIETTDKTEEKIKDASETEFLKVNGSKKNWNKSSYYVDMLSKK